MSDPAAADQFIAPLARHERELAASVAAFVSDADDVRERLAALT